MMILSIAAIFSFSLFSAKSSHLQSQDITSILKPIASILGINDNRFRGLLSIYHYRDVSLSELIIRKLAHFTEYLVLGIIAGFFCSYLANKTARRGLMAITGILVALIDEKVVQVYFSVGRSSSFKDVVIDSCGYFVGVLIFILLRRLIKLCFLNKAHTAVQNSKSDKIGS